MNTTRSLLALSLLVAAPARAYVDTTSTAGTPVRWPLRCVIVAPDARGDQSGDDIDGDVTAQVLTRAAANWNSRIGSCSYMALGVLPATRALDVASDGRPAVVFRSDTWGSGPDDKTHSPAAIGLTTVWFIDRANDPTDGQITDADIELNAVNWTFTTDPVNAVARPNTMVADLENTLTHELGHVLGLGHTCWDHIKDTPPLDENGNPAPDCMSANLPDLVTKATMYPYVTERGTSERVLSDDDVKGICDAYPIANASTLACYGYIEGAGCAFSHEIGSPRALWVGGALFVILVAALRRRRRGIF